MSSPTVSQPPKSAPASKSPKSTSNVTSIAQDGSDLQILADLNTKYVFVRQMAQVIRIPTADHPEIDPYHPTTFVSALEARRGSLARRWLSWAGRNEVYKLVYSPGQPRICNGNLNTWIAPTLKSKKGDISLWTDYLNRVFALDPTYLDWFTAWLAYPLQYPGTKLHTAVLFWSEQTGTGKSMLGRIMRELYGPTNYAQINESSLHGQFNHWAAGRQFIMGEEIRGRDAQRHADALKAMITQQTVFVNIKNRAHYELTDCLNYYFTSNHDQAFYLDEYDRRFFVHNIGEERYPASKYRDEFEPWFYRGGGSAALLHYLTSEVDLAKPIIGGNPNSSDTPAPFNPGAPAPHTSARKAMIQANRDDAQEWLDELLDSPATALKGSPRTLASAPELYNDFFVPCYPRTKIPYKTFCSRLRARIKPVYSDNKITLTDGQKMKVYPLRDDEGIWKNISHDGIVSAYEGQLG